MSVSLNCRFVATPIADSEWPHPLGIALVRLLASGLVSRGWRIGEPDNWRDCGWFISCEREGAALEAIVCPLPDEDVWIMQIAPRDIAGFFGRIFGGTSSAKPNDVLALAQDAHRVLCDARHLGRPRWRWDGAPDSPDSTDEPETPKV